MNGITSAPPVHAKPWYESKPAMVGGGIVAFGGSTALLATGMALAKHKPVAPALHGAGLAIGIAAVVGGVLGLAGCGSAKTTSPPSLEQYVIDAPGRYDQYAKQDYNTLSTYQSTHDISNAELGGRYQELAKQSAAAPTDLGDLTVRSFEANISSTGTVAAAYRSAAQQLHSDARDSGLEDYDYDLWSVPAQVPVDAVSQHLDPGKLQGAFFREYEHAVHANDVTHGGSPLWMGSTDVHPPKIDDAFMQKMETLAIADVKAGRPGPELPVVDPPG
jgi:hypothetical protein